MRCELYQRSIPSAFQTEWTKPYYETWCKTHGCPKNSEACLRQRITELEMVIRAAIEEIDDNDEDDARMILKTALSD